MSAFAGGLIITVARSAAAAAPPAKPNRFLPPMDDVFPHMFPPELWAASTLAKGCICEFLQAQRRESSLDRDITPKCCRDRINLEREGVNSKPFRELARYLLAASPQGVVGQQRVRVLRSPRRCRPCGDAPSQRKRFRERTALAHQVQVPYPARDIA